NAVLAITGVNAQGASDDLEAMAKAAGSVDKSIKNITGTTAKQWNILRNRIKSSTQAIGEEVLEMSGGIVRSFDDLTEPSGQVVKDLEEQRIKLFEVEARIRNVNTTNEDRIALIKELKIQYPGLLGDIDAEKVSNDELAGAIRLVNDMLINKIILQKQDDKIT